MTTSRTVPIAERDAALGALLDLLLERLPTGQGLPDEGVFMPLVAHGATLAFGADELDGAPELATFARAGGDDDAPATTLRPAEVMIHDVAEVPAEEDHEYAYETIRPGADWLPEHRAKFWRLLALVHDDRYSDSLLNLRADALDRALPWYREHDPVQALRMMGERARVMLYASYGEDKVMPVVDAALELWPTTPMSAADERHVILQLLEVLDRIRLSHDHDWPKTDAVLELAARGIELDGPRALPQTARFFHALADGLTHGGAALPSARVQAAVKRWGAAAGPLVWARGAWDTALAIEDGDFYGKVTHDRAQDRRHDYRRGLAILDLREGRIATALATLAIPREQRPYPRSRHARLVLRILVRERAGVDARIEFLRGVLLRDVLEAKFDSDYEFDQAAKELAFVARQLANLGADAAALVQRVRARPGIAEAIARTAEKDRADDGPDSFAARLAALMMPPREATPPPDETPEAREARRLRRWNERLASAAPRERTEMLVDDARRRQPKGGELLVEVRDTVSDDGRHVTVTHALFAPEVMADEIWRDPAVLGREQGLLDAIRTALPDVVLDARRESLCLVPAPGETESLAIALTHAGATQALTALGLAATPVPGDADAYGKAHRKLVSHVRFEGL